MPGQHCLLAEGDISAPIYWRTDAPRATTIGAPIHPAPIVLAHQKRNTLQVHRVNRVLGFLSSCPYWDPQPLNPQVSVSPPLVHCPKNLEMKIMLLELMMYRM